MNNIIINLLLRANLVRGFEGILNFMRVCLFFMHNDFIIITPTETDCLWWESFRARQLWWEGGAAASTGRTSQIQGRSGRTTMRRRRCLRVRAIRRVWTGLGWGAWLFANWLREANSQAEVIQVQACWKEPAAALNTLRAQNRGRRQGADGSTEADADTAEPPPRPRTNKWQPTWAEVGEENGTVRPTVAVDYYSSTGFLQVGAKGATAGLSLLLSN